MYTFNNSKDADFSKQTNNKRSAMVACFTTSMINAALAVDTIFPKYTGTQYDQLEDQYDEFIYSPAMTDWYTNKAPKDIRNMIAKGIEPREIWAVQEHCFNAWVGYDACKIKWNLNKADFIKHLFNKGTLVMGGKFCGFGHMVSVCGYKSESDDPNKVNMVKFATFDDSFGDPRTNYNPRGIGGNNVDLPFDEFWNLIRGDSATAKYAVLFEPGKYINSPLYVEPAPIDRTTMQYRVSALLSIFTQPTLSFC